MLCEASHNIGLRYTVAVRGKQTHMWLEDSQNKWFMEAKDNGASQ